jgi:hypothetical protein
MVDLCGGKGRRRFLEIGSAGLARGNGPECCNGEGHKKMVEVVEGRNRCHQATKLHVISSLTFQHYLIIFQHRQAHCQPCRRVYYRPTDLLLLPLLISAVSLVCKQNNTRLNFGSVAAQFASPQSKVLAFNSPFYPNFVDWPSYRIY